MRRFFLLAAGVLLVATTNAQLVVKVSPARVVGQKAVVPLELKNRFDQNIESARAVVFLLDEQGRMAGQGTRWIVGGARNAPALAAGKTNRFFFVITSAQPFATTNLTAKVSFSRVILDGGKLADVKKEVIIKEKEE